MRCPLSRTQATFADSCAGMADLKTNPPHRPILGPEQPADRTEQATSTYSARGFIRLKIVFALCALFLAVCALPYIVRATGLNTVRFGPLWSNVAAGAFRAFGRAPGGPAFASFVVTKTADTDDGACLGANCSLRDAINAANAAAGADTITFNIPIATDSGCNGGAGPCTISLDPVLPDISDDLNINGPNLSSPGNTGIIVKRSTNVTTGNFRVLTIALGKVVSIDRLTISNGKISDALANDQGAGIFNAGTLTLTNSTVSDNTVGGNQTDQGGGIYNSGTLTVTSCAFSNNAATGGGDDLGGAIYSTSGTATITGSSFSGNKTTGSGHDRGGAIYVDSGTVNLSSSTLSANISQGGTNDQGGGIYVNGGILNLTSSTLSANQATGITADQGGGIFVSGGSVNIINSTLSGNLASGTGHDQGGGIYAAAGTLQLTNCTIASNAATNGLISNEGGGIYNDLASASARNTIIALNTANTGPDAFGTFTSQGDNFIGKSDGSTGFVATGDQVGSVASPINPLLGVLEPNGGPTQTRALLTGSTAIDGGDDCVVSSTACANPLLTTDQRGAGFPRQIGLHVDIGAFEGSAPPTSLVVNSTADTDDGFCTTDPGGCTLREAINAADSSPNSTITFDSTVFAAPGPYTINLLGALPGINTNMSITGPGDNVLAVRRANGGEYRIFTVANVTATISGLTITNGHQSASGADDLGGGIFNNGSLTLNGVTVSGNLVTGDQRDFGGGIYNTGTLSITNGTISNNEASGSGDDQGGGIYNAGTLTITNSTVSNNLTDGNNDDEGGGIHNANSATLTMVGCTVSGNAAKGSHNDLGAGIYNAGTASITSSTISDNDVNGNGNDFGGGIFNAAVLTMINSTVSGNLADGSSTDTGGGIFNAALATLNLTNCTISHNTCDGSGTDTGGGIFNNGGTVNARNTIVAVNVADTGADFNGTLTSLGHNAIGFASGAFTPGPGDLSVGDGTSLHLGVLRNNGGPTQTMILADGSVAIDAGDDCVFDNTCSPSLGVALTTDQRGAPFSRQVDGNGDGTAQVDIGAFEEDHSFVVNTAGDANTGTCTTAADGCSLRDAINAANAEAGINHITFNIPALECPGGVCTITLGSTLPAISDDVTIDGIGQTIIVSGNNSVRVMTVNTGKNLELLYLTIANGRVTSEDGGGILNNGTLTVTNSTFSGNSAISSSGGGSGGAVVNSIIGTLTVTNSTFSGNTAAGGGGGAIDNSGTLNVANSTFSGNNATLDATGGAVATDNGTVVVTNCTFANNSSAGGGGGIAIIGGTVNVTNSTFSGNSGSGLLGGGILRFSGTLNLLNTIIANSTGGDCKLNSGTIDQAKNNLIKDTGTNACGLTTSLVTGNIIGSDPNLGSLADNGGPTQTFALLNGSPAIDAGTDVTTLSADINSFQTTVTVVDATAFAPGVRLLIQPGGIEQMEVVAISGNTLTVIRGANGTESHAHPAGTAVNTAFDQRGDGFPRKLGSPAVVDIGAFESFLPEINVKGNNVSIVDGDTTPDPADDTDFGSTATSGGTVVHTFTIENTGAAPLNVSGITITGTNQGDFSLGALTPASPIPAGNSATFIVTFDPTADGLRTATINIANDDGDENPYDFAIQGTGSSPGTLQFSAANYDTTEGNIGTHLVTITVQRVGGSSGAASVHYATSDGSATLADNDYDAASGDFNWADGDTTSRTFDVTIHGDTKFEAAETITLTLSAATGAALGTPNPATVTISNDDSQPTISINDVTLAEGNSGTTDFDFTVSLSNASSQTITVNAQTADGTATTADSDYTGVGSTTLTFAPDVTTQHFHVQVNGDTKYETNENFFVNLSGETNATILDGQGQGTITNDDAADTDLTLSGGVLTLTDTNGTSNDTPTISLNGSNIRLTDPNNTINCGAGTTMIDTHTCEVPFANVTGKIQVNGLGGDDSLTINLAGGNCFPPGGISYDGGTQTSTGDKLAITGGSQGTVTYNYTNANDGSIDIGGFGTVTYTGLEPISNSGTASDIIFNLPTGPNVVTLGDDGTTPNGISRLSGATFEQTDFANPTGSLTINRGNASDTITVNALPDFDASLTIGSGANPFTTVTFNGAATLASNKNLSADASATINVSDDLTTSGTGTISLTGVNVTGGGFLSTGGGLTVSNTGTSSTLSGVIAGNGGLTKQGAGTLTVSNANTYTGATAINGGRLNINGSITSNTTVSGGGTLGGTGTIASANTLTVNSSGTVAPGTSPGILNTGNVTFTADSVFAVEIGGTTAGSYDQLNVTGTVALGGATLNLSPASFTPVAGDSFTIINNDATDPVSNVFLMGTGGTDANGGTLAEGDKITNFLGSGLNARITYAGGSNGNDVVLTVFTPAPGTLQFSAANYPTPEGNSGTHLVTITVQRVGGADGAASVHYATSAGTATAGTDYLDASGDFNWADGDATNRTFEVTINGDTTFEPDETINLTLSSPTGASLGTPNPATVTITNDDSQPTISINDVTLAEGNSGTTDFDFTVSLSNASSQTITVNAQTADGTATTADSDYTAVGSTTLTFDPNVTTQHFHVLVNGDVTYEPNETFFVNLSGATNATILDGQGLGTITNDDAPPTSLVVNSTADTDDGFCTTDPVGCTLREAINAANSNPDPTTITFDATVFAAPGPYTINLSSALPAIDTDMSITGPGANVLTVQPASSGLRIFQINSGKNVAIDGLTIANGSVAGTGGAILNDGALTVTNSTFSGNSANIGGSGGAISNRPGGTLTVNNSTFSANTADGGSGGAINNTGTLNVTNSTFSGNSAINDGAGGAVSNSTGDTATLTNCTFSGNSASFNGGGIFNLGTLNLRNTIIANSTKGDCVLFNAGAIGQANNNLIKDAANACGLTNGSGGNIIGSDPNLGSLANNGGPTMTFALLAGSPAIDAGDDCVFNNTCSPSLGAPLTTDQRGGAFSRQIDGNSDSISAVDIGAFEAQTCTTPPTTPTATNGGPYCEGATIQLSTPTVAGATYSWTGPNGFTSSNQNPTLPATAANAGAYAVTITVGGCTSAAGTTDVVVNPIPATPTASNGGPYCEGATIQLSTPSVSGATYAWTGPNGFTSSLQNPTLPATLANAGTYSVTVTVNGCTSAAGTTNVVVNPIPATPTASNGGPYCEGATIQLSTPTVAGATYSWTGPNGFTSSAQNPTRANATTADAGTFSVTITVNGCPSAAGTTNVVVNAIPATPTASNSGPYCEGATIQLSTPTVGGATYSWTGPNGFTSAAQNPTRTNATTADAGTYSVTITVNGCTSAAGTTNVVVNAIPATPTASNGGPYCEGQTIQLSTPTVSGATYSWTGPNGFTSTVQNPTRANVSTSDAGSYSVTITVNGCTSAAGSTTVVVNPTPATPAASNGGPYSEGQTIQLSTPTVSGATYSWTGPNGFTSTLQNPTHANATAADAGAYSVTVTVNGCTSASGTTNVIVLSDVSVTLSPQSVAENSGTALVYTFTRSNGSGTLAVNFLATGTADPNTDYTVSGATFTPGTGAGTVSFNNGETSKLVSFTPIGDTDYEANETVIVTISPSGAGDYNVGSPNNATGTIKNDDNPPANSQAFVVNNTSDDDDGACVPAPGPCSLRDAINAANANGDTNRIEFAIPANDPNHIYYIDTGTSTPDNILSASNTNVTAASDDTTIVGIDPDWPHSWWRIMPVTNLPAITSPVFIDGQTQPGAAVNTDPTGQNGVLRIELDGQLIDGGTGFDLRAGNSTINGLNINQFVNINGNPDAVGTGQGIKITLSGGNTITANFVGTDISGLLACESCVETFFGNQVGILIDGVGTNTIGGASAQSRNLISANLEDGIEISGSGASGNKIQGNFIGTNAHGDTILDSSGNGNFMGNFVGVSIYDGVNNVVGNSQLANPTALAGAGNVISGNVLMGVEVSSGLSGGPSGNGIGSNMIGTDLTGTKQLPNAFSGGVGGVEICQDAHNNLVGGSTPEFGNVIAFNGGSGVEALPTAQNGNTIRLNSIHDNALLGIDLNNDGVTENDPGDADTGPNELQNFPVIDSAITNSGQMSITGHLNSTPGQGATFTIDLYANASCNDDQPANAGHGEGQTYLGSVSADGDGNQFTFGPIPAPITGTIITATATNATGSTSEFSQCFAAIPVATVQFAQANTNDTETNSGSHTVSIAVARTDTTVGAVDVTYTVSDGTATLADNDYSVSPASGTLHWNDGDGADKNITITVNGDTKTEPDETVNLSLSSPAGAVLGAQKTATLTIINDDSAISGHIDYCITPSAVPNATISVTGSQTTTTTTDASGNYSINLPAGGSYTLTPSKTALTPGAPGIDTADVIGVQRQFLGMSSLNGCALTAADATKDSTIDTTDAVAIQQFFLHMNSGTAHVGEWQFNPGNRPYSGLTGVQTSQDYSAVVIGDVSGDLTPAPRANPDGNRMGAANGVTPSLVATVSLPISNVAVNVTDITLPVTTTTISASDNLVGFQGDFSFDSSIVTFQLAPASGAGLTATNWNVSANILGAGTIKTLRISAFSTTSTPLSGSGTLFNLNFTRVSNTVGANTPLQWAQPTSNFVFIDTSLAKPAPGSTPDGSITIAGVGPTAAGGTIAGQVLDSNGVPVEGVAVRMNGAQNRLTITDASGNYHFDNVETGGLYVITPSRANFTFSPAQKAFSQLGAQTEATFTGVANNAGLNPLDTTEYFVRQQYLDFLGREPDEAGFNFWINNIESCGADAGCREAKRVDTSAAFFLSIEFQHTGYLVYRTYEAAYGNLSDAPVPVGLTDFTRDTRQVGSGLIVLQTGWQQKLDANTRAFMSDFVQRPQFVTAYPTTLTPQQFVDNLFRKAQLDTNDPDYAACLSEFGAADNTSDLAARARAFGRIAENSTLTRREFDRAFVLMEYFGYLRRDPNTGRDSDFSGYSFWLRKLDQFDGNFEAAEMVKAFLASTEYRGRFPR